MTSRSIKIFCSETEELATGNKEHSSVTYLSQLYHSHVLQTTRSGCYYTKTKQTKTKNWGNKKQPNEYQNRLNGVDYV